MKYALDGIRPQISETAWVAPGCHVIGRVTLGADVSVWFGAVLRGDNEWITVGEGSNLQEHCVMHTDPGYPLSVGRNCTIGHRALLHGCTIGDNVLVGMGATVMNGAVIGDNCLIGAGALIPECMVIPAGSLVMGMPGKVVRALDAPHVAGLTASAQNYQEKARRFQASMKEV
jgi:carbonic anhydrase/acetyltransferase-like protein (isoleucine patch superfamily)